MSVVFYTVIFVYLCIYDCSKFYCLYDTLTNPWNVCVCVCVCVCTCVYVCIYDISVYVCVCVCVCM